MNTKEKTSYASAATKKKWVIVNMKNVLNAKNEYVGGMFIIQKRVA